MKKHLWILTEERPKLDVLETILGEIFAKNEKIGFLSSRLHLLPLLDETKRFSFVYEVVGFTCAKVDKVFIKTISGSSSFVDYALFFQNAEPTQDDVPNCLIEETKTGSKESRNTAVFQRATKFVYAKRYYPNVKLVMLYHIDGEVGETATSDFGLRLLLTLGVRIVGWKLSDKHKPFQTIDELIDAKNAMRKKAGNVSIEITRYVDKITISGRLVKDGRLAHDPNIGALSAISFALRTLGWRGEIQIVEHGLKQAQIKAASRNKFIQIATRWGITLQGIELPNADFPERYWRYETEGEKLGTIFICLVVENFTSGYSIFENHAGCEKGYFTKSDGERIALPKYQDREAYKKGDKTQIIAIPDLILLDVENLEILNVEGKKFVDVEQGIEDLKNYDAIERLLIEPNYPDYRITRTVVLYGGTAEEIFEVKVGFLLNRNGGMILGIEAPKLFRRAIANLLDYWKE